MAKIKVEQFRAKNIHHNLKANGICVQFVNAILWLYFNQIWYSFPRATILLTFMLFWSYILIFVVCAIDVELIKPIR